METKKRKGYSTQDAQNEANKRYLANNPEAKEKFKISSLRSNAKRFINSYSNLDELKELEELILARKEVLKKG